MEEGKVGNVGRERRGEGKGDGKRRQEERGRRKVGKEEEECRQKGRKRRGAKEGTKRSERRVVYFLFPLFPDSLSHF